MAQTLETEGHLSGEEDEPFCECRLARHIFILKWFDVLLEKSHPLSFWVHWGGNEAARHVGLTVGVSTEQLSFLFRIVLSSILHAE